MIRKRIPPDIQERVLVESRRRCALCFGLNRDTALKQGQVAHLDRDASNNSLDNLVFLCLPHHDEYDSRTSQSKGLTASEVRRFRRELHEGIDDAWRQPVQFGSVDHDPRSRINGHYIRDGEYEIAELDIVHVGGGRVRVAGLALWGMKREYGPNLGDLDFEADIAADGAVTFVDRRLDAKGYCLTLRFSGDQLEATEEYIVGQFGMNVSFAGAYRKVGPPNAALHPPPPSRRA